MAHFNGQGGDVSIGETTVSVAEWKIDIDSPELNTTSTSDAGWSTNISAPKKASGSFKVYMDDAALLTGVVLAGTSYATTTLTLGDSVKVFSLTARITKVSVSNPSEETVTCECSFVSTGPVTIPS